MDDLTWDELGYTEWKLTADGNLALLGGAEGVREFGRSDDGSWTEYDNEEAIPVTDAAFIRVLDAKFSELQMQRN